MRTCLIVLAATLALGCKKKEEMDDIPTVDGPVEAVDPEPQPAEVAAPLDAPAAAPVEETRAASAELVAAKGKKISGVVSFAEEGGKVRVTTKIDGLSPGPHGFHVHANGACDPPDFKSAGDHFSVDPAHPHAGPTDSPRHTGDLGNIEAAKGASAEHSVETDIFTLGEGPNSIVGKAVVIHEKADDLKTQPSGDSGGRIACGIIKLAEQIPTQGATAPATDGGAAPAHEHVEGDGHKH